ncbi:MULTISPECIES: YitT family protein [Bacillus]|uniref:YitT family protein n=1 Tax=Bacillus TaxID=1386 RepID=UPI000478D28F|nr:MULTISPECIES: YitT family protein [Bacillus]QHZ47178.1 YitT family protein [Bacillus sp. NSP9.1]WFA07248.1 YitT family protein [Bacillus sp. HSf4]
MGRKLKIVYACCLGSVLQGLGMALFLFPNHIPSGGAAGIAVLLNFWFQVPHGLTVWAVNISLLLTAVRWLEPVTVIGTMGAITMTSVSVQIFETMMPVMTTNNIWLDLFYGAVLLGAGVGLLYKYNISNGGFGALALMISIYRGGKPGTTLFFMNAFIFLFTASVIAWGIVIQALVCQWISTKIIDAIYQIRLRPLLMPLYGYRNKK